MDRALMLTALLPVAALAACTDKGGDTAAEDPAEHACEQVGGDSLSVTAAATVEEAPAIEVSGNPYTVALVDGAAGYVSVEVTEDTPALLFVGTADVVTGLLHDGEAETLPQGSPNELCAEGIPEHFDLDLHPGTWTLALGPAAVSELWLVLSPAEGHGEH